MILATYLAFLAGAALLALLDWRRAWLMIVVAGVIHDPVRKLTPGAPVVISFLVIGLYAVIVFSARAELIANLREFGKRFPLLYSAGAIVLLFLGLAALNGIITFGVGLWKVPFVSLFTYLAPLPAFFIGYTWLRREEMLYRFLAFYAVCTVMAMTGTVLEYYRVPLASLGTVAMQGDYIRHLPGIQVRLLSGFYRSPDVMAWHAGTLTCVAAALAMRGGFRFRSLIWTIVASGGFALSVMSGRRKAIYYVVVFAIVFLWRYLPRARGSQATALIVTLVVAGGLIRNLASGEETSVYTRTASASPGEIVSRLEGGIRGTIEQSGWMGAGLGMATQGTYHLVGDRALGWQEGGLGKLTAELGVPGLLAVAFFGLRLLRLLLRLTAIPDVRGSSQFGRAFLFAFFAANAVNFAASAQAYTDAILTLLTAFFGGCLLAMAALDERLPREAPEAAGAAPATLQPSIA